MAIESRASLETVTRVRLVAPRLYMGVRMLSTLVATRRMLRISYIDHGLPPAFATRPLENARRTRWTEVSRLDSMVSESPENVASIFCTGGAPDTSSGLVMVALAREAAAAEFISYS